MVVINHSQLYRQMNKTILIEEIKKRHEGGIKSISKELNVITLDCGCKYEWNNFYNLYVMNVNFNCPHLKNNDEVFIK